MQKNFLTNSQKVLIIRLSSIGDVLHASTVAQALKTFFPYLQISWVVESKSKDVIEGNSNLENVFVWQRKEWNAEAKKTGDYFKLVKRNLQFLQLIRQQNFDTVIDLQSMYRSDLISYASGAKYRICLPSRTEVCLGANIHTENKVFPSVYERYLSSLTHFGIESVEPIIKMPISSADEWFAQNFMTKHNLEPQKFVIFNPSSTATDRRWPLESFAKLGDLLANELQIPIVVCGANYDKYMAQGIALYMNAPIIDATGTMTLKQLGAVAAQAGVFISGDTGPLYVAYGVNAPTVALFGHARAAHFHLDRHNRIALQAKDSSLQNLTVEEVWAAVRTILASESNNSKTVTVYNQQYDSCTMTPSPLYFW